MIKKSGVVLLAILYLVTAVGFALNFHYCGDEIASVKLNTAAKSCGMIAAGKMKCCRYVHLEVKVKDAHQAQTSSFLAKTFVFQFPLLSFSYYFISPEKALSVNFSFRGPPVPVSDNSDTFLKNCTFRI